MKRQLTVVFAIRDILAIGGAQLNALRLAKEINERGCKVLIIGQGGAEEIKRHMKAFGQESKIQLLPVTAPKGILKKILKRFPNAYFWIPCLYRLWTLKNRFDILYCPLLMDSVFICALTEILLEKPSIIKIGSAGQYGDVSRASRNRISWLIRLLIRKISMFVCMTEEIEAEIREEFNMPSKKIMRIPNGIDTKIYSGMTMEEKIELRHSLGIPEDKKIVLFVGRLEKKKRVDFLIRSWSRVCDKSENSPYLLIVGDGTLRKELEGLSRQLNIDKSVIFHGYTNKIPSIMQVSNVFVLPSVSEGLANVILEAMSSGLPIVATNTKGNAEILTHQVDAMLFKENDQEDLANGILFFLENENAANDLCYEAQMKVTKHFSIRSIAAQYIYMYHRLTSTSFRSL